MHDVAAQFTRVTKPHGAIEALRGLDLTVRPGELLALLGLVDPAAGEFRVFGGDRRDARTRTRPMQA